MPMADPLDMGGHGGMAGGHRCQMSMYVPSYPFPPNLTALLTRAQAIHLEHTGPVSRIPMVARNLDAKLGALPPRRRRIGCRVRVSPRGLTGVLGAC
jgi:hypothetical protein